MTRRPHLYTKISHSLAGMAVGALVGAAAGWYIARDIRGAILSVLGGLIGCVLMNYNIRRLFLIMLPVILVSCFVGMCVYHTGKGAMPGFLWGIPVAVLVALFLRPVFFGRHGPENDRTEREGG